MSIKFFSGFETGDSSEFSAVTGTAAVVTSPAISGGYAGKITTTGAESYYKTQTGLNLATLVLRVRFSVHITTNPTTGVNCNFITIIDTGGSLRNCGVGLSITSGGLVQIYCENKKGGLDSIGPAITISTDTVYLFEVKIVVSTTIGMIEWKLNGAVQGVGQGLNTGSVNSDFVFLTINSLGDATANVYGVFDDVAIDDTNYCGTGRCLVRQGTVGTPTYDTFTKIVGATAQECWSETPYSVTKACTSITNGGAQTMLAESFANIQSGHGTEKFWTSKGLTINACKVAMIAKVASGSSHSIRRRLNGVNTDTAKTLTTADAYYDDGIWTDTYANINSMEIGVLHGADVNLVTIEDMWVMMDVDKFWILGPH